MKQRSLRLVETDNRFAGLEPEELKAGILEFFRGRLRHGCGSNAQDPDGHHHSNATHAGTLAGLFRDGRAE